MIKLNLATSLAELIPLCETVEETYGSASSTDASSSSQAQLPQIERDLCSMPPTPESNLAKRDSSWREEYLDEDQRDLRMYDTKPSDNIAGRAINAFARNVYFPLFYTKKKDVQNNMPTSSAWSGFTSDEATKAVGRMRNAINAK